jgi:hypothetical protein
VSPPRWQVLIAGAGWRVWRFVVPALLNEGISREQMTIVRRSASAELHPVLRPVRTVTSFRELSGGAFDLTLNCVLEESLLAVQQELVRRYPRAVHLCDTPIFSRADDLREVVRLSKVPVYSLEDWPLMPNLEFLAAEMRRAEGNASLSIEHFGIPGHFLSLYRSICGRRHSLRGLRKVDGGLAGEPRSGWLVRFRQPKQFAVAKASLRTQRALLQDFHEVETTAHSESEIIYRIIGDSSVRYYHGARELSAHRIEPEILEAFQPFDDRKNVHELDKCVALCRLFRSVSGGADSMAYSYLSSARDAWTARRFGAT